MAAQAFRNGIGKGQFCDVAFFPIRRSGWDERLINHDATHTYERDFYHAAES